MNDIQRTQQRTLSYWFGDGITEIVGGVALVLVGLPLYAAARFDMTWLSSIGLGAMILLFPASAKVVRFLKDRITHQRTGYVSYPKRPAGKRRRGVVIVLLLAVPVISTLIVLGDQSLQGIPSRALLLGMCVGMGAAFLVRAVKMRLPRFLAAAAACLAVSSLSWALELGFVEGLGLLWLVLGGTLFVTGSCALLVYLHRHPRIEVEDGFGEGL
jgi:hypothetical protein